MVQKERRYRAATEKCSERKVASQLGVRFCPSLMGLENTTGVKIRSTPGLCFVWAALVNSGEYWNSVVWLCEKFHHRTLFRGVKCLSIAHSQQTVSPSSKSSHGRGVGRHEHCIAWLYCQLAHPCLKERWVILEFNTAIIFSLDWCQFVSVMVHNSLSQ